MDRMTYSRLVSDKEASETIIKLVSSARGDRKWLQDCIYSHGDTILARWKKYTRSRREACVKAVEPDMYPRQLFGPRVNADLPHWSEYRNDQMRKGWLTPYLNVEALTADTARFLGLLHSRTKYAPEDWVAWDSQQIRLSWFSGALDVEHNDTCVILHGYRFGELVAWEKGAAHRWYAIGYPRATLVLESQARTMSLLRKIVSKILEGVDLSAKAEEKKCDKWKEMVERGFRRVSSVELWSPFTNQAFSPPPVFEIDGLITLAQAESAAKQDHIWLLQTSPSYLRREISLIRNGAAFDVKGLRDEDKWSQTYREVINLSSNWDKIIEILEEMKKQYMRFRDSIDPASPLPKPYDKALGSLELMVVNFVHARCKQLTVQIPQSKGFRQHYRFKHNVAKGETTLQSSGFDTNKDVFEKGPLYWCLMQLLGPPDADTRFDHAMLLDFLDDHLSSASGPERSRLDVLIYEKISDYSALLQVLMATRLNRPLNTNRNYDEIPEDEKKRFKGWRTFVEDEKVTSSLRNDPQAKRMGAVLKEFMMSKVPSGKQNEEWLKLYNERHEIVREFWKKVYDHQIELFRKDMKWTDKEIEEHLSIITAAESQEHLDSLESKRENIRAKVASNKAAPKVSAEQPEWSDTSRSAPSKAVAIPSPPQPKTKTRGTPNTLPLTEQLQNLEITEQTLPPISVNKTSYSLFSKMFPTTAEEASTKEIDWKAFVSAMADAKFIARNGGGSAVLFDAPGSGGKIVFHKPHPVAKIDPVMLHSMGRRMGRRFGWERERFVVESEA